MARLLEYENYKDLNGVKIPDSWELSKVKYLANYLNGFAFKPAHWTDEGIPIIRIQNLTNQNADINKTSFIAPERYHVVEGDILISWSATLDVYIWQKEKAWLNQHIYKVTVNGNKIIEKYFYWTAKWFMGELNESSHGSTMQHLTTDKFGSFNVPLPPISEQHLITNFLDHETAQIDTLIEKQQTLIQLLKEKRQAVISHAVTKGLNSDAQMKDSGVEWLGEVPEHWNVGALKYWADIIDCKHITAEFVEDGYPLASISEVKDWTVNLSTSKFTTKRYYLELIENGRKPIVGDILYSRNATVGEAALVIDNMPDFAMGQDVCLIRSNDKILSDYIMYVLNSGIIKKQLDLAMVGSTFKRINVDNIRNFDISFPSIHEQQEIIDSLKTNIVKYDSLVEQAEQAIQLMQERRTALISAAVTGKIDVRGWHASDGEVS